MLQRQCAVFLLCNSHQSSARKVQLSDFPGFYLLPVLCFLRSSALRVLLLVAALPRCVEGLFDLGTCNRNFLASFQPSGD